VFEVIGKMAFEVPRSNPSQLSVADGAVKVLNEHELVTSANTRSSGIGATLSFKITFCVCDVVFPLPSLKIQVTVVLDVIGSVALVVALRDPEQLSVAVGGFNVVIEQVPVTSGNADTSGTGAVTSSILISCD